MRSYFAFQRLSGVCVRRLAFRFLLLPALAAAQTVTEGTLAFGGGGALLDGDRAAYQKAMRQKKDGFGGIEDLSISRLGDDAVFRLDARVVPGNEDYRVALWWERPGAYYISANYQQFRIFYDGSGGRLLPLDLAVSYFDEALAVDRSYFSLELGTIVKNAVNWRVRYDRNTRDGTKNSLLWGDSNLGGALYSPRAFIPGYFVIDEARDIITAELSQRTENTNWKITGRYQRTKVNDKTVARRRAGEPQDRFFTMRDGSDTDLFSGHAYYDRTVNEQLRVSAGGIVTTIDTQLSGSRVYGGAPDAEYNPTFARGQAGDGGYRNLVGTTRLKQYVGNANASYQATKHLVVLPGIKYEHLRQDSGEDHIDTSLTGTAAPATERPLHLNTRDGWNELTEDLELRYLRWKDWSLAVRGQWNQGTGNLDEQSILLSNRTTFIDHAVDYRRVGQRYTASATWYAKPGLTLGAQLNYRLKTADYTPLRDSTSNLVASRDRYPNYIVDNDIESRDAILRLSWRPRSNLTLTTRYAHQRADISTLFEGLGSIDNGRLTRHVITEAVTWNATPRLYVTGTVNVTYDRLWVPPHRLTVVGDNNYSSALLGAGYAVGKVTDLLLDLSHYRADNYSSNPEVTLPLNAGQTLQSGFITWVRRQSARLIYTAKYGYATNRDGTYGGQNNYSAHVLYGKVQLKF